MSQKHRMKTNIFTYKHLLISILTAKIEFQKFVLKTSRFVN